MFNPNNIVAFSWADNDFNTEARGVLELIYMRGEIRQDKEYLAAIWNSLMPGMYLLHHREDATLDDTDIERMSKYFRITPDKILLGADEVYSHTGSVCMVDFRNPAIEPIYILAD